MNLYKYESQKAYMYASVVMIIIWLALLYDIATTIINTLGGGQ